MEEERKRILEMLQQGQVTVDQAAELLNALEASRPPDREGQRAGAQAERPAGGAPRGLAELGRSIADSVGRAFGGGAGRTNFSTAHLTQAGLSRMQDGTSYTNFGHLVIADDVPADLLGQKIGSITNFGSVTGPEDLLAVLEARCDENFGSFGRAEEEEEEEDDGRPKLQNLGKTILTQQQLANMADGVRYANLGKLIVAENVSEELLAQKIAVYENLGNTQGPANLLGILQARCPENLGKFELSAESAEEDQ
ncbi:MAG: hypothetical protein JSV79_01180 [Armatimonadota bacterium]|nr:MAG: hypothetical protein JSV79_01180 [Armatimonadota bacterium]